MTDLREYFYPRRGFSITIDLSRDNDMSDSGQAIMKDRYTLKEYDQENQVWRDVESSPQECFARAACEFATNKAHAQRLYDYVSKQWAMFATPILTNAGTSRGMPISCFLNYVPDSIEGIMDHVLENGFLSSYGGGIGGDWSHVRSIGARTSRGNVSTGLIPFVRIMDSVTNAVQQGSTRRGAYAAYCDVSHPEIEEFIEIRDPAMTSSSDFNRRCTGVGFHHAVNIPDAFMEAVSKGTEWNLIDPKTEEVRKTVDARTLWMRILTQRLETGEPYIHFIDTSNRELPKPLKDKGLRINSSNLCSEIMLPTDKNRTAVCCLSSVNVAKFEEWYDDPLFIQDMVEMLDNVLEYFINNAPKQFWRAVYSAQQERSIGLGTMGFHIYLQSRGIPFESPMAVGQNMRIYRHIKEKAVEASRKLASERGEAPDMLGTGLRFAHLMAIAPNANIANICGDTSPSIEPFNANVYRQKTLSGDFIVKNKVLDKMLRETYNLGPEELEDTWLRINRDHGSVQNLEFMSEHHKQVFKTALEIDPMWIIEHAAVRQPYICQGQSVNVFLPSNVHKNTLHRVHFVAWEKGLKALYYCRSTPARYTEGISKQDVVYTQKESTDCLSCEG